MTAQDKVVKEIIISYLRYADDLTGKDALDKFKKLSATEINLLWPKALQHSQDQAIQYRKYLIEHFMAHQGMSPREAKSRYSDLIVNPIKRDALEHADEKMAADNS